ncbi:MAG: hypothetical protein ACLFV7_07970 [Phycisphaerae bacterium]
MRKHVIIALIAAVLCGMGFGMLVHGDPSPTSFDRMKTDSKGRPVCKPRHEPGELANPWPENWEDGYRDRVNHYAKHYKGKANAKTTGEHEKWGLPENFGAYIAGDKDAAIKGMQATDNQAGSDHAWTRGIDFYWCFTLKGQAHKYFYYGDLFDKGYLNKMYKAATTWTSADPRPSLELVHCLRSEDAKVVATATKVLKEMWRSPEDMLKMADKAIAEGKANPHHKNKIAFGEHLKRIADQMPDSTPGSYEEWMAWWKPIAQGGWMVFEEYERRCNPNPHPKHGIGTGPVGAAWDPKVRGMRADARNTDNLRAMRESAIYLFAEETGNEDIRRLYKDKLLRTGVAFWNHGNGEWDSEGYLAHTMSGYSNLYSFARDKEVRAAAKAMLDYLFLSAAKKYYRGAWGGPVKRDYGNYKPWSGSASLTWLFFGDAPMENPEPERDCSLFINSGYRPPAAIVALARKQFKKPVEIFSSHPTYETWLPGNSEKPEFFETMYYGHTYQLGTTTRGHGYNMNGYKLLCENSRTGADYFIPATYRGRVRNPVTDHAGGDNVSQYRNVTLWLNGNGNANFSFLMPPSAQVEQEGGLTFVKFQKTWLVIRPINLKFTGKGKPGKARGMDLLTAQGTGGQVSGFAVEVGEARTHGSYDRFKTAAKSKGGVKLDGKTATATGIEGISLKMEHTGGYPKVWRDGKLHQWTDHDKVFQPADGSKTPCYLGWKERKMVVEAGGHRFEGELTADGKYTFKD